MALRQANLNQMTCGTPGCDHSAGQGHEMAMLARCHIDAGVNATYRDGAIRLECHECGRLIADVLVAP